MKPFEYIRATRVKDAVETVTSDPAASYIAGGTNLVDLMKRGIVSPGKLVDINHLPLKKIEQKSDFLRIGALALNSEVANHKLVIEKHPLLSQALHAGASGQLRNMATVGGNMLQQTRCPYFYDTAFPCNKRQPGAGCAALKGINRMHAIFGTPDRDLEKSCIAVHPSDMSVALLALNTNVLIASQKGERKIPITDLHRLPGDRPDVDANLEKGELITAIEIPDHAFTKHVHYLKVRDRASYAFALISVAVGLEINANKITAARVVLGGVAHKPWRLPAVENILTGQTASESMFKKAAEISMLGARSFEHNAFKLKLAQNAILEALKVAAKIS